MTTYTWTFTATDTSGNVTNQLVTIEVTADEIPSINIHNPYFALKNKTSYPPQFDVELDDTVYVDDVLRLQAATDYAFSDILFNETNVLDIAELNTDEVIFSGLNSITSPEETYFRVRIERGSLFSDWSPIIKHGDITAPTLSSSSPTSWANSAPIEVLITANEVCHFSLGGINSSSMELYGPQPATSIIVRLTNNENSNYDSHATLSYSVTATDLGGNPSTPLPRVEAIIAPALGQWTGVTGTDKSTYVNTPGTPRLIIEGAHPSVGALCWVRCQVEADQACQFEIEITETVASSHFSIGFDTRIQTLAAAPGNLGGPSSPNAATLAVRDTSSGSSISANGVLNIQSSLANSAVTIGDVITARIDPVAGTVSFFKSTPTGTPGEYTTVQLGTTVTGCTWASEGFFAIAGIAKTTGQKILANFGSSPFIKPLESGYVGYNQALV